MPEYGCRWRGAAQRLGNWHTIYTRMSRWSKNGALGRVLAKLQLEEIVRIKIEPFALDSTSMKVRLDGTWCIKTIGVFDDKVVASSMCKR